MTNLLEKAVAAARRLSHSEQDEVARTILQLIGSSEAEPLPLTLEERQAVALSRDAMARGEYATDEQVHAVWTKHGG